MAFDAGMTAALAFELNNRLAGARVDRVQQPETYEIVLSLRADRENLKLSISSGADSPRINLTNVSKENPVSAPSFCMLLRKHLVGSKILSIRQIGFERLIEIAFDCRDEMGYAKTRYLMAEIMGKYSNIIFCDDEKVITGAIKPVDFTTSSKRQVLPGMNYEYPPAQDKMDPLETDAGEFDALFSAASPEKEASKFLTDAFSGISLLTAREIVYRSSGNTDATLYEVGPDSLRRAFFDAVGLIREKRFSPCLLKEYGEPFEYSFMLIKQYGGNISAETCPSFSGMIDVFYSKREKKNHIRQLSSDLLKALTTKENRVRKKIFLHKKEISDAEKALDFKNTGDLITSNIFMLKKGDSKVTLTDYYSDPPSEKTIALDPRLTPSGNAQRYYKKYSKAKNAISALGEQLKADENELAYIGSVIDSLERAEGMSDLEEIRNELANSGYSVKRQSKTKKAQKPVPAEYRTENGFVVLCGKNNIQNDAITFGTANKLDLWFHVKNIPGSHCVLICRDREPTDIDVTQAAVIAATNSKAAKGDMTAVDYTLVKNVKKISSAKPGLVTYSTNKTAYVRPDEKLCEKLRVR